MKQINLSLVRTSRDTRAIGPLINQLQVLAATESDAQVTVLASPVGATVYLYVSVSATPPTESDIISGAGAEWFTSFLVSDTPSGTPGPTGLSSGTDYFIYAMAENGTERSAVQSASFTTTVPDTIAPTLSAAGFTVIDVATVDLTVTSDEANGTLYAVVSTTQGAPSAPQMRAGQDSAGAAAAYTNGGQAVSVTGEQLISATGLTGAAHYAYFMQDDAAGNTSTILEAGPFTPADVTAPIVSSVEIIATGTTTVTLTFNTDTGEGDAFFIVQPTGDAAPTVAQVKAGSVGTVQGQQVVSASGAQSADITGLSADTGYLAYVVHTDAAGNDSNVVAASAEAITDPVSGPSGPPFTDDLSEGAGTPVAITTTIQTNQAWQRGRDALTLSGTYDLSGDPTGMAWRVGAGDWVQLTSETIGGGSWTGTLSIPSDYLAQGELQVKPINGMNVSPATHANVTVTDVFAILGDSMAAGVAHTAATYTKTNFDWIDYVNDVYSVQTSQTSVWVSLAENLDAMGIPPAFVRFGASGSAFRPDLGGDPGGSWEKFPAPGNGSFYYDNAILDLNAADTGGWKAFLWEQGPNDAIDGNMFYETNLKDLIDNLKTDVENFSGMQMIISVLGQVDRFDASTIHQVTDLREAQLSAIATDTDILRGPSWIDLEFGDGIHFGRFTGDDPANLAQLQLGGDRWWRAVAYHVYGGTVLPKGPEISAASVTGEREITITFDRAVANHTDATGWEVVDGSGVAPILSSAQGVTPSQVVLTMAQGLRTNSGGIEVVSLSFGKRNDAAGATLRDTETIAYPIEYARDESAGEAYPFNTVAPALDALPEVGIPVTTDNGTWESTSALVYTYQWREAAGGAAIPGATDASYTPVSGDSGYLTTMVCDVTATNSKGSATATSGVGVGGAFSPQDAFSGEKLGGWWRPDVANDLFQISDGTMPVTANGDPVGYIADASGNGNHMIQRTAGRRMTYDTGATYVSVSGDGTDDYLATNGFAEPGTNDVLVILAADFDALTGAALTFADTTNFKKSIQVEHDMVRVMSNDFNGIADVPISPSGHAVVTVVATQSDQTFRVYVNGGLAGSSVKTGTGWFGPELKEIALGRRGTNASFPGYAQGGINQGLVVIGPNVADDRAALERYFGNLIGLGL